MKIGIIGMGWFGKPFAQCCVSQGHQVLGTNRESKTVESDIQQIPFEFKDCSPSESLEEILSFSDVLVFDIPPSAVPAETYKSGFEKIASGILKSNIQKAIFISSTSVFSNAQGDVNEVTTPVPDKTSGKFLYEMEQIWLSVLGDKGKVVRPGGLIGEERHPIKHLSGREKIKGQKWPVNLIHQDDLVSLVYGVVSTDITENVFHAVAKMRPEKQAFYTEAAKRRELKAPLFDSTDESQGKGIDAELSKEKLGVTFKYDDPYEM